MMRRYGLPMGTVAALYILNRFLLAPLTGSRLLAWHGADFLAGALMLCILNGLLEGSGRRPVRGYAPSAVSPWGAACSGRW